MIKKLSKHALSKINSSHHLSNQNVNTNILIQFKHALNLTKMKMPTNLDQHANIHKLNRTLDYTTFH